MYLVYNSRGQVIFYTMMLAIVLIILALAFAPTLKIFVEDASNPDNLDCTNSSISNFDRTACLITDVSMFYFIGGLIFLAGAVIVARVVFAE